MTNEATPEATAFSNALTKLADTLQHSQIKIAAQTTIINVGAPVHGKVIGESITMNVNGPGQAIGKSINMSIGDTSGLVAERDSVVQELRDAIEALKTTKPPKSWIDGLLKRAGTFSNAAVLAAVSAASATATTYFLGPKPQPQASCPRRFSDRAF